MLKNIAYSTTVQDPPSAFFQQAITVDGIFVGVVFANTDFIQRFTGELNAATYAGCDGTFKTVPSTLEQLGRGTLMVFQVVYKNVVSWFRITSNIDKGNS